MTIRRLHVPGLAIIVFISLAMFVPLFKPEVSCVDPAGYYAWARSVLIDGNLDVANEFEHYGMDSSIPLTSTGLKHNQWPAGSGWLWLPAMTIAHVLTLAAQQLGFKIVADGYSWPYVWAASLTSVLAGFVSLWLTYRLCQHYFNDFTALLATITIWLATPFLYYQYHAPTMSHANDALMNALFVWQWWKVRQDPSRVKRSFLLGLVIGAAVWVRTQNVILLAAMAVDLAIDLLNALKRRAPSSVVKALLSRAGATIFGFLILLGPLLFFWRTVFGSWLVNTYALRGGTFDWRAPYLLQVLFSTNRGLFIWAPITILSVVGLRWLYTADRRLTLLLSGTALLHLYLIGCWSAWYGGDAFGPRYWVALTPMWALGLNALLYKLDTGTWRKRLILSSAAALIVAWNILLMLQYSLGLVPPQGAVDLTVMFKGQFTVAPRILATLIQRVRNW